MVFHNLDNHNFHLNIQKLGNLEFKINVVPNGLVKCMSININNKLIFIDTFHFLRSPLDSLVKMILSIWANKLTARCQIWF